MAAVNNLFFLFKYPPPVVFFKPGFEKKDATLLDYIVMNLEPFVKVLKFF